MTTIPRAGLLYGNAPWMDNTSWTLLPIPLSQRHRVARTSRRRQSLSSG